MCFAPKVPKESAETQAQRQSELDRVQAEKTENKEKALADTKRVGAGIGTRSLIKGSSAGFGGRNFFG